MWRFISISTIAVSVLLSGRALAALYSLSDNFQGSAFFNDFSFEAIADPTHGRVNYVSKSTAQSDGLATVSGNNFILRADDTSVLSSSGAGRNSFRIQSNKQYTTHVAVFNVEHMPEGCGTWPAIWEVGDNWPNGGEVDIVEGVNDESPNTSTLHTSSGCTMPASRLETGNPLQNDCNVAVNSNAGCGVQTTDANSYGPSFNKNGGGWYAIERTNSFIKVWFWARNDGSVPSDVSSGASSVNTGNWGTPDAYFPNTSCDISSHFGPNNIIINLTFCGDWAGNVYASSGCPSTCVDYVNNNPSAFVNAYFEFPWVKVYE
ncbi:glycoside hydrolase family 16 protein [Heterobasidion irregulare TC 32-1]|uniref:Glycoside hydrolase family 16 protein n=1 Tax=Heterobasidion irregulare (strain TC 32-1) TaxID=747525 RepID=W4JRY6_HETIT|nr:glycoside hydrolase family 16 protein [Heterobasidion irregulare TC 32-1]ETW76293.1 glycoside hydrolase family 16 protein [Heterobasidion irregulare TC 32-1]